MSWRLVLASMPLLALACGDTAAAADDELSETAGLDECEWAPFTAGSPCESVGLQCGYADTCSSCTYTCTSSHVWSQSCTDECDTDGPPDEGSDEPEGDGDGEPGPCGDGYVDVSLGELCDDGDDPGGHCQDCKPVPWSLGNAAFGDMWPDVDLVQLAGGEEFLVAHKSQGTSVVVQTYDGRGEPTSPPVSVHEGIEAGPLALAGGAAGGALLAWQDLDVLRTLQLDEGLEPLTVAASRPVAEYGGDPKVAAGPDGSYCVAGIEDGITARVTCFDARGGELTGSSWPPMDPFGGVALEGKHDLLATDSGYVYVYVPEVGTHALWAEPLDLAGAGTGLGFEVASFDNPLGSWVGRGRARAGLGFVLLAGELGSVGVPAPQILHYRSFLGPAMAEMELTRVGAQTTIGGDREGTLVSHDSGRFAIAWVTDVIVILGRVQQCELSVRLFRPDATPYGLERTLWDPGVDGCVRGIRGASNSDGDVLWTWRHEGGAVQDPLHAAITPGLLSWL